MELLEVPVSNGIDTKPLLEALMAVRKGDYSVRLPVDWTGAAGKVADTFNEVVALNERMAKELELLSRVVGREGRIELEWLRVELAKNAPAFVGVMAANNETGVLQPWRDARAVCQERGVPFFCDAAQWVGKLPAASLGQADYVSGCAHKFGGPTGVGFLKVPGRVRALLDEARGYAAAGNETSLDDALAALPVRLAARLADLAAPSLRPVINATGVVVHTNLGRAPLPASIAARVAEVAAGYCNLE